MGEIRVLHMADMHLDWPFAGMGADGLRGRLRREELKEVFAAIIDLAEREGTEVLLLAGDLYEHASATRGLVQFADRQFRRIPQCRVFISPGNHDPYLDGSYWQTYPWASNVHVFSPDPERVDFVVRSIPVSVRGWGFGAYEVTESQLGRFPAPNPHPDAINLCVFHGGEGRYHPFAPAELAALRADYVALGHIHKQGPVLEQGRRVIARYPGSPEALSFGEPGEHGVYAGTVGRGRETMAWFPTGRREYITAQVPVGGAESLEDLTAAITACDEPARRRRHCYRVTLTGAVDPDFVVDLPLVQEKLGSEFYFLRLDDQTRPDHDLSRLATERSARGLFVQRLLAMEAGASDDADRRRIRRAMVLGLAAFAERGAAR